VRVSGPNLILSPPLVLTEDDVTIMLNAIDAGFAAATKSQAKSQTLE
jgi:putrescine aminotransferase